MTFPPSMQCLMWQLAACIHVTTIVCSIVTVAVGQVNDTERDAWTSSRLVGSPEPPRPYTTERVFPSLEFDRPAELTAIPGTNRLALLEANSGKIYSFENRPDDPDVTCELFADVSTCGPDFTFVYGLAFHPQFPRNRYCFVSYVLKSKAPDTSRVSRFQVTETNPPRIDLASEEIVFRWQGGGHNGAHLQFGPDGYLYISTGDGGDSFPPDGLNTGQDVTDVLASILRIDVDARESGRAYRIPPDNPFVNQAKARGEIWAFGLRNPWKMCFDPADSSLWVADVGWEKWEMIYAIQRGGNYGWSIFEGEQPVNQERSVGPTPILPPTTAHSHIESRSITGGYFYQASRLPDLKGAYIYGDYVTGKIWGLRHQYGKVTWREELVDTPLQISTFGIDRDGDVLIVDYPTGTLHRLTPNPRRGSNSQFPKKLSETGMFSSTKDHAPATGVLPYSVSAQLWSDGATAERLIALPGKTRLDLYDKTNSQVGYIAGEWKFPDGGVLAKTVSIELELGNRASSRRLETQLLHFDVDTWKAYNYIWNDEQTDAFLADDVRSQRVLTIRDPSVPGGTRQQTWQHVSRTDCLLCHTTRVGTVHGFRMPQLDRHRENGGSLENQLSMFSRIGLFSNPLPTNRNPWPDPYDSRLALESRARSYLQVNCGHCHSRGGGGSAAFDVQYPIPLEKTRLLAARPTQGTFGILDAQVVAPGDPYRSVLYYRLCKLGHGRMPQFGAQTIDERGVQLIHDWISSLHPDQSDSEKNSVQRLRREEQAAWVKLTADALGTVDIDVLVSRLLATPSGAMLLNHKIARGELSEPVRRRAVELGSVHVEPTVRDLFERFLPEEKRTQRLGNVVDSGAILAVQGNAVLGKKLMLETSSVQCKNCHRIGDQGESLGPDLTLIGRKLDKAKLLETILEPSKSIDPQFTTHLVETADGQVITGLLVKKSDTEVTIRQADRKEITLSARDIERLVPQQKSLMPELLLSEMTAQQVRDLLEYLSDLK